MGDRRFRSIEEMPDEHWYEPGDPMLYRAIRRVWELGHRTLQPHFPPGVYKHRTMESKKRTAGSLGSGELHRLP